MERSFTDIKKGVKNTFDVLEGKDDKWNFN
jgi:hypothetical protein